MDSFISWIGGKKLLRKAITERFPESESYDRYIEVFGGAGWVLFSKDLHAKCEIFNDIDSNLVNLYRCLKYHREALEKELQYTVHSREVFMDCKQQLNMSGLTDIQRAARYFILIRSSFGSDRKSFKTATSCIVDKIGDFPKVQERLNRVVIENKDFEDLIKVYDRPSALFYLDPPYHTTEKYYNCDFGEKDHIRLRDCLQQIKGKFILSYNNDEFIKDLYKEYNIEEISRNNNLSINRGTGREFKELIIKNY